MQRKSGLTRQLSLAWKILPGSVLALLIICLSALLGGCSSKPAVTQRQSRKFEGRKITVSCPGNPSDEVVKRFCQPWTLQTGARVEVLRQDPKAGPEAGPAADLWIIPPARMPHWAAAGKLHEVPMTITAAGAPYAWEDVLRTYQKLLVWDRKVYALPLLGDELICFYRKDLFKDEQIRADYKKSHARALPPPEQGPNTWDEFADIAEYFNKQIRPGIDHPCPSLPPLPKSDDDLDREFYLVAVPFVHRAVREDDPRPPPDNEVFSFHYDLETGAARIHTSGFVHGLELLLRLQACRPSKESAEPPASFQKGEAVLCLASPSWIGRFQSEPGLQRKFGICRPPGSRLVSNGKGDSVQEFPDGNFVPYLGAGGWVAVVPRSNETPDAAFALAAALGDPNTSREIVIEPAWGGGVFRRDQFETRAGWQAFGLADKTDSLLQILRDTLIHTSVKNPVMRLRIPDERAHQEALLAEVRAVLLHGKEPDKALNDALKRWQDIDAKKAAKIRRSDYRLSLSLSGD